MATQSVAIDAEAYFDWLLRVGDNCLVLGHRVSEWCGHAPALMACSQVEPVVEWLLRGDR